MSLQLDIMRVANCQPCNNYTTGNSCITGCCLAWSYTSMRGQSHGTRSYAPCSLHGHSNLFFEYLDVSGPVCSDAMSGQVTARYVYEFVVWIYLKTRITAPLPINAPNNDLLLLLISFLNYSAINPGISKATSVKFSNDLWYLSP